MKISFGTRIQSDKIHNHNGYGYATQCMLESLQRLGYHVSDNDSSADVEIWFDQPQNWRFSKGPYKIGYHPWESTKLMPGWASIMNECDEIWTPSPLIAQWYKEHNGVNVPIYVYQHGIEHSWKPEQRVVDDKIRFLHVGAEAARKGGWTTYRLFNRAFAGRYDVELTLKTVDQNWNHFPQLGKTKFVNERMPFPQLQQMFYDHHVYVYPSWGEGFGLTPLQALASGMPTITLPSWAPYAEYIDQDLAISSQLKPTTWPKIHPGKMLRPSYDDIIDSMRYAADHYEDVAARALKVAPQIHEAYDWDALTYQTFSALEKRLESR